MTADLENRCVAMIGNLWHANQDEEPMGTSTVGSSEACMLGGLGMLFRWKKLAKAAGVDIYSEHSPQPGYQRRVPGMLGEVLPLLGHRDAPRAASRRIICPLTWIRVMDYVDDHTIGIIGHPRHHLHRQVTTMCRSSTTLVDRSTTKTHPKLPIRIHVDGASGGMFAPFVEPDLVWDFQSEERVVHQLPPATSTASCTPASAGWCGAARRRCPRT